jgi:Zn-dependent protease
VRIAGVVVRVRPSFLLLGVLAGSSAQPAIRDQVPTLSAAGADVVAAVVAVGLLASVLLHELAHASFGRRLGLPVERVDLTLLGGATSLGAEPRTARDQYLVSVSGPVVNLLLGCVFAVVSHLTASGSVAHVLAEPICVVNVLLALYNLLPGLPLDGGQLVRAVVWRVTGDKIIGLRAAGIGGLLTSAATLLLGYLELRGGESLGILTVAVGVFVAMQAQGALLGASLARRLPAVVAGRLARPAYLVASDLPVSEALRRAAAAGRSAVVLGTDGRPSAVLSDVLLARVPEQRRPWVSLSSVSSPAPQASWLDADLTGEDLIAAMAAGTATEYVVMHDGTLVGVLLKSDVASRLRRRR